jgi:aspartyl-tRNA(Asn)/glutamyl-tRNA(Gln) amidotransferase subunit B
MRSKEEANDYRYFPDPDLLPVEIDESYVEAVRNTLPELPDARKNRLIEQYSIKADDAEMLTASRALADYFEEAAEATTASGQVMANWITGELSAALNREGLTVDASRISADSLASLIDRIDDNTISGKIAKVVFDGMWSNGDSADQIIEAQGLKQITDSSAIDEIVDAVIAANPGQAAEFRAGKEKLLGFFVGQVMQKSKGKANPAQVNEAIKRRLAD